MWIADSDALLELCDRIRKSPAIALDTEFTPERRYVPRFDLLQIGAKDVAAAIDVRADLDLSPLMDVLSNPKQIVALHSGATDLAILYRKTGRVPAKIFDTQLACSMVGYGDRVAYSALVKKVSGVRLLKAETLTDWSRRPLKSQQVEYALDDVRYLLPVYEHLLKKLEEMGRLAWFEEEAKRMLDTELLDPPSPRKSWHQFGAWTTLSPRQLGVLIEVSAWREQEAISRNVRPRAILPDGVVVYLARRQPEKTGDLRENRQIFERTIKENGRDIVKAIRRGLESPDEHEITTMKENAPITAPVGLPELVLSVIQVRAAQESIAPSLLADSQDIVRLISDFSQGRPSSVRLLSGWRRELVGRDILRVLTGAASLGFDPGEGRVRLEQRQPRETLSE